MEQGTRLTVRGELFAIERDSDEAGERRRVVIQEVRMTDVDEVLIFGTVSLTPAAVAALLDRGIDTVFLTAHGRYRGRLIGKPGKNVQLRLAQFERLRDHTVALALARSVVGGKIANQRALLLRSQREQKREDLAEAIAAMRRLGEAVEAADTVDALRGIEGQAAALYFGVFGKCLRNPDFSFDKRTRRPPRDPVNAVLSFGYTLLAMGMESFVLKAGLDPMVGVFHAPDYGRPSLVLDLIEEFRPVLVDSLALRLFNRRELAREDFEEFKDDADALAAEDEPPETEPGAGRPVWLGPTGRKIFFRAWGRRLREAHFYEPRRQALTLEDIMQQQVYQVARILQREQPHYASFVIR
jgi:CRISPR-associated protein Cas1